MTAPSEQAKASLITPAMRAEIGIEGPTTTLELDKSLVRLFARATGHTDQIFYDEAAAKAAGYRSLPCPPGFLGTPVFNPGASGAETAPRPPLRPSRPLARVLHGGSEIEYLSEICAGDVLTVSSHLSGLEEAKGSIGEMLLITTTSVYKRDGQPVAVLNDTIIRY